MTDDKMRAQEDREMKKPNEEYFSGIKREAEKDKENQGEMGKETDTNTNKSGLGEEYYSELDRTRADDDHDLGLADYDDEDK